MHFGKGCTSGFVRLYCSPNHLESLGVEIVKGGDPGQIVPDGFLNPATGHPMDSATPAGLRTADLSGACNPVTPVGMTRSERRLTNTTPR
ncbi:hypothetical protein LF599_03670 [Pseudodesulfovibrio thermohalotolerans]|uniref:hypothetical protein n=1 Tax=Pseudodesulfovibrio thermohalotolerans TaxID=2880651 RepID=UPI0022B9EA07|nr:hypothetical protein [Pseudodesulfovibrio thermohalotolerans]WFS63275.1 hypothetical protein LF599_03670 [Pseudodesulfovibrio thermohalotolerans]